MTLIADVARINAGDTVTAEFTYYDAPFEITGRASKSGGDMMLGPFTLAYEDMMGVYPNSRLLRVIAHQPAPKPLYTNRPDIKAPRAYDVVVRVSPSGKRFGPYIYDDSRADHIGWRNHSGTFWETAELLEVGPLTLVGEAIQ